MKRAGTVPVLFVMAPGGSIRYFPEHLGAAFLRTMLHRSGIHSRQYLPGRNPGLKAFSDYLQDHRPVLVGFTVYEANLLPSRAMIRVVHDTLPETVVLVGGPNATFSPEETLGLLDADGCLRGSGEGRIVPIVQAILHSSAPRRQLAELLSPVKNLVLRTPGRFVHTESSSLSSF